MKQVPSSPAIAVETENLTLELNLIGDMVNLAAKGATAVGGQIIHEGRIKKLRALDGISFSVNRGAKVGIIGQNGAGKTTLLRTLAGIHLPSSGRVRIDGRVSTLFTNRLLGQAQMTGREAIMVSCLLMGIERKRIKELTPDIIAFSELEDFIDLPQRTYSAGMAVRLGFAIATCIEPDILLIDEVFGAGDRRFQEKARERINKVMESASTMFLASQSMHMIQRMCDHVIWLDHGKLVAFGPLDEVLPRFLEETGGGPGQKRPVAAKP